MNYSCDKIHCLKNPSLIKIVIFKAWCFLTKSFVLFFSVLLCTIYNFSFRLIFSSLRVSVKCIKVLFNVLVFFICTILTIHSLDNGILMFSPILIQMLQIKTWRHIREKKVLAKVKINPVPFIAIFTHDKVWKMNRK